MYLDRTRTSVSHNMPTFGNFQSLQQRVGALYPRPALQLKKEAADKHRQETHIDVRPEYTRLER